MVIEEDKSDRYISGVDLHDLLMKEQDLTDSENEDNSVEDQISFCEEFSIEKVENENENEAHDTIKFMWTKKDPSPRSFPIIYEDHISLENQKKGSGIQANAGKEPRS